MEIVKKIKYTIKWEICIYNFLCILNKFFFYLIKLTILFYNFKKLTKNEKDSINLNEFFDLFQILIDLSEYRKVLRLANSKGEEFLDVNDVYKFLTQEQGVS